MSEFGKETSLPQAVRHVASLVEVAKSDVSEVRTGMPEGSRVLESLYRNSVAQRTILNEYELHSRGRVIASKTFGLPRALSLRS